MKIGFFTPAQLESATERLLKATNSNANHVQLKNLGALISLEKPQLEKTSFRQFYRLNREQPIVGVVREYFSGGQRKALKAAYEKRLQQYEQDTALLKKLQSLDKQAGADTGSSVASVVRHTNDERIIHTMPSTRQQNLKTFTPDLPLETGNYFPENRYSKQTTHRNDKYARTYDDWHAAKLEAEGAVYNPFDFHQNDTVYKLTPDPQSGRPTLMAANRLDTKGNLVFEPWQQLHDTALDAEIINRWDALPPLPVEAT